MTEMEDEEKTIGKPRQLTLHLPQVRDRVWEMVLRWLESWPENQSLATNPPRQILSLNLSPPEEVDPHAMPDVSEGL